MEKGTGRPGQRLRAGPVGWVLGGGSTECGVVVGAVSKVHLVRLEVVLQLMNEVVHPRRALDEAVFEAEVEDDRVPLLLDGDDARRQLECGRTERYIEDGIASVAVGPEPPHQRAADRDIAEHAGARLRFAIQADVDGEPGWVARVCAAIRDNHK